MSLRGMEHTELTLRNFSSYSFVIFVLGTISVGFGAVDLAMVAPLGVEHVAAVGQADLFVTALFAFFLGMVDVFSSRVAIAEGEHTLSRRLWVLVFALLLIVLPAQLIAVVLAVTIEPILQLFRQSEAVIPLIGDYVSLRSYGLVALVAFFTINETLKICGLRSVTVVMLIFGFLSNAALNWVFLYSPVADAFRSPEQAVAASTVVTHGLMALGGVVVFVTQMRARDRSFLLPRFPEVAAEFRSMVRTAPGIGVRHLNDYMGALVPLLLIGTISVEVLAAAGVATRVYILLCRIPQACFAGTFVYYGYSLGRAEQSLRQTVRTLRRYSMVPTAVVTVAAVVGAPLLVGLFAGAGLDNGLARLLLFAYLLYIPAYFFEQFYGEMLTVHQRGGLLFKSSTVLTYGLTIPMAVLAVGVFESPFWALASKGLPTALLALIFYGTLRRECWTEEALRVA